MIAPPFRLRFLLFGEGFLSLAFQMLAIRQLLYVSGGTILETSLVVAFFLLALARGYQVGGRPAPQPLRRLAGNLLGAGLASLTFTPWISALLFTAGYGAGMVLYLSLGVIPIAYLMGQSIPLLVQAQAAASSEHKAAARYAGDGLGLSTYGSFLGALAVPLVGFPLAGVGHTHLALVVGAATVAALAYSGWRVRVAGLLIAGLALSLSERGYDGLIAEHRGPYGDIQIIERADERLWISNRLVMSRKKDDGTHAWYVDQWRSQLAGDLEVQREGIDVLVLGAAGYTLTEGFSTELRATYVDIDPEVEGLAREHFVPYRDEKTITDDARRFILHDEGLYDRILMDVYSASRGIPEHLITVEFLSALAGRLKAGGEVWFNTIRDRGLADRYSRRLHATITAVFPLCLVEEKPDAVEITNVLYRCQSRFVEPYRDDKTSAALDAAIMDRAPATDRSR